MKNKKLITMVIFIVAVVLIFIILRLFGFFSTTPQTYPAVFDTLEFEYKTKGYLFFNETIIESPVDGRVEYLTQNGERVSVSQPIATVIEDNISKNVEQPPDIDSLIIKKDTIEKEIKSLEDEVTFFFKEKNTSELERAQKDLSYRYAVYNQFNEVEKIELNKPVSSYTRNFSSESRSSNKYTIYANIAGIVSQNASFQDTLFNLDNIYIMDYSKFPEIKDSTIKREVKKGEPFLRIIDNGSVYLVIKIEPELLSYFESAKRFQTYINGVEVETVVDQIFSTEGGYGVKIKILQDFESMKNLREVDLIVKPVKNYGIVINEESIVKKDGEEGVYILRRDGSTLFVPIEVQTRINGKCIITHDYFTKLKEDGNIESVETISVYDEILRKPDDKSSS